jgi:hypothetical protein
MPTEDPSLTTSSFLYVCLFFTNRNSSHTLCSLISSKLLHNRLPFEASPHRKLTETMKFSLAISALASLVGVNGMYDEVLRLLGTKER